MYSLEMVDQSGIPFPGGFESLALPEIGRAVNLLCPPGYERMWNADPRKYGASSAAHNGWIHFHVVGVTSIEGDSYRVLLNADDPQ